MHPDGGDSLTFNDGGPLARHVDDAALMLSVVAGHDSRDPISLRDTVPDFRSAVGGDVAGLRLAYSADLGHFPVDSSVADVTRRFSVALADLGCHVDEAQPEVESPWVSYSPIYLSDAQAGLAEFVRDHGDDLYPETHAELAGSEAITGAQVAAAFHGLHAFRARAADFFERYDVLLTPATAVTAFPVDEPPRTIGGVDVEPGWMTFMPFSIAWNMTGQPTASVPCGFVDGLPVGLMMIGRHGEEHTLLRLASAIEAWRPWTFPAPGSDA